MSGFEPGTIFCPQPIPGWINGILFGGGGLNGLTPKTQFTSQTDSNVTLPPETEGAKVWRAQHHSSCQWNCTFATQPDSDEDPNKNLAPIFGHNLIVWFLISRSLKQSGWITITKREYISIVCTMETKKKRHLESVYIQQNQIQARFST